MGRYYGSLKQGYGHDTHLSETKPTEVLAVEKKVVTPMKSKVDTSMEKKIKTPLDKEKDQAVHKKASKKSVSN